MRKVNPHINVGSGYVQIAKLPFDQALAIRNSFPDSCFQNIQTQEGYVEDVLEYSQYEYWFDFQFNSHEQPMEF